MTMEILCVGAPVIPGEWELKFPLGANRNLTLSITPQSPPGSTAAGPRRKWLQMSFTLLFSSYLFHFFPFPCSHIFSWCLMSMAAAWVALLQKYWLAQQQQQRRRARPHKNATTSATSGPVLEFEIWAPAPRLTLSFAACANFLCVRCGVGALLTCRLGVVVNSRSSSS